MNLQELDQIAARVRLLTQEFPDALIHYNTTHENISLEIEIEEESDLDRYYIQSNNCICTSFKILNQDRVNILNRILKVL